MNLNSYDTRSSCSKSRIPVSVDENAFENGVHHVFNLILIFLKLLENHMETMIQLCIQTHTVCFYWFWMNGWIIYSSPREIHKRVSLVSNVSISMTHAHNCYWEGHAR